MTGFFSSSVIFILNFLWIFNKADTDIFCQFTQNCTLPCTFTAGDEVVVHWIQLKPVKKQVHSFYHNSDQLGQQDESFKGRTSLSKDQISRGNASLQLSGVKLQDEGQYQCYTSTIAGNKESFIQLKVYAPVQMVTIEMDDNQITCSSHDVYPEPDLTWTPSPSPPSQPTRTRTDQQLYSISSSLIPTDRNSDYSCTISTSSSKKRATLVKEAHVTCSDAETTISCGASDASLTHLTWRFDHTELILTRSRAEDPYQPSDKWEKHVKNVSETGSLTLMGLTSDLEGIYTCELSNTEETYKANTVLQIKRDINTAGITAGAIVAGILLILVICLPVVIYLKKRNSKTKNPKTPETSTENETKPFNEDVVNNS